MAQASPLLSLIWIWLFMLVVNVVQGNPNPGTPEPLNLRRDPPTGSSKVFSPVSGPVPNTGVTRNYEFSISRGFSAPDGFNKSAILVNNQYPGPLLNVSWGDVVSVTVTNNLKDEGTSIHWHGITMITSPWADGVPGISQCPIPPGEKFTYTFQATEYGVSWYHSHVSAQYIDGVFGAIVITAPDAYHYDIDFGPVILNDCTHVPYYQEVNAFYDKPPDFLPGANNLINGKMPYNCSLAPSGTTCDTNVQYANFEFQVGKVHRLRLINAGGAGNQRISIDSHLMTVVANDFVPIKPYHTGVVTLGPGQRSDILVTGNGDPTAAVWIRAGLDPDCLDGPWVQPYAIATVYYPDAERTELPTSSKWTWPTSNCSNDPLNMTTPLYPQKPSTPAMTRYINIAASVNSTGYLVFEMNNRSTQVDYNAPPLLLAAAGNDSYPSDPSWNIYNMGTATSIRVVLRNFFAGPHSMHLHGHSPWILAEGRGEWDGVITNPENPQRRDTQLLQPGTPEEPSYLVLQWDADNPGVWPFHCHVVLHVSAGLLVSFIERPDLIKSQRQIPSESIELCKAWGDWTSANTVDQIDSGL